MENQSDILRRLENIVRHGQVSQVKYEPPRVRVKTGKLETDWLPWFTTRSGDTSTWSPATAGEPCVVFSPSGDPAVGFVLLGMTSSSNPPPSTSPHENMTVWPDGTSMRHNAAEGVLELNLKKLVINCSQTVEISGAGTVKINGSMIHLNAPEDGQPAARIGDDVDLQTAKIVSGSSTVVVGG